MGKETELGRHAGKMRKYKRAKKEKKEAKKAWEKIRDENSKNMYKEKKSKAKKAVVMAKRRVYKSLYARLEKKKVRRSCKDWLGRETERGKIYST